jgi:S-adenosylmethionine hydrolase
MTHKTRKERTLLSTKGFSGKVPQISLLTDFGHDEAVYSLRSSIAYINPKARVEDICHMVPATNILVGAWRLARAVSLPTEREGTAYVAVVDPGVGTDRKPLLIVTRTGKFFIGPDNGLLSLAAASEGVDSIFAIENRDLTLAKHARSTTFDGKDVFAPVAAHLSRGVRPDEFGNEIKRRSVHEVLGLEPGYPIIDSGGSVSLSSYYGLHQISWLDSSIDTARFQGFVERRDPVVDIDTYGNIRSALHNNVPKEVLGEVLPFTLEFGGNSVRGTAPVRTAFGYGVQGEVQLILSSTGCLDLVANCRNAASQLGFSHHDIGLVSGQNDPLFLLPTAHLSVDFSASKAKPATHWPSLGV